MLPAGEAWRPPSGPEPLAQSHDPSRFDCGNAALDDWLQRFAWASQRSDAARTFVVHRSGTVVGYYSLSAGSVHPEEAPARVSKGLGRYPIGVVLLARLAVNKDEQGRGLGKALLKDALLRVARAADTIGARAVLVHAIDEEARRFYRHFGFEPSPVDDLALMLLMKDLRASLRTGPRER